MPVSLYDAHIHLAHAELLALQAEIDEVYDRIGVRAVVCNGTSPDDWPAVLKLAKLNPRIIAGIGLHPWKVPHAAPTWKQDFLHALDSGARVIAETGLDQWIEGYDIAAQQDAFRFQLGIAAERNLPLSIHCLRAIGPLIDTLRSVDLPERGIHIHAYNGPIELIPELSKLGAYFSFNAGQLRPDRPRVNERIQAIPANRLLIETDAPDFLPVQEYREFELKETQLCHPGNIRAGYEAIAALRELSFLALAKQVESNFLRYFG